MQNAPFEYGWAALGAMSVTHPSSTVSSEPQHTEHSQQVLGTTAVSPRLGFSAGDDAFN
jgi:hypothetical protein